MSRSSERSTIVKQPQQITHIGTKTTIVEVWKWGQELERLNARIAPRFARPEPRRRALAFLKGIVSSIERKNSWHLAEHAGESRPDGMQRLLNSAAWDADLVRDDLRASILERLGDLQAVLVIDETSFRFSNILYSDRISLEEVTGCTLFLDVGGSIGSSIHCYKSILHLCPSPSVHNRCVSSVY
jgi:DDE superfamily endonuclease